MSIKLFRLFIITACFIALTGCVSVPSNFQSVLQNMAQSYPGLWRLATAFSYVMGFFLGVKAIYYMKIYGEARTMMSTHSSLKTPIVLLITSSALIFLPTTFHDINLTFFATPNLLSYTAGPQAGFT